MAYVPALHVNRPVARVEPSTAKAEKALNTPAHALIAVASLAGGRRRPQTRYAILGAVLPDLPMFGFYFWQRGAVGLPETQIWQEAYFRPEWQLLFDAFNSAPAALLGLALALLASPRIRSALQVFFGAILLHVALDLPFHHDDAHRHFLPLTQWRFESPVSYWDPSRAGALGAGLEVACVLGSSALLWRRFEQRAVRAMLVGLCGLSLFGYAYFYGYLDGKGF
jgi:hypothetical protein